MHFTKKMKNIFIIWGSCSLLLLVIFQNATITGGQVEGPIEEVACSSLVSKKEKGIYDFTTSIKIKNGSNCIIHNRLRTSVSNITLDCNGATIDGGQFGNIEKVTGILLRNPSSTKSLKNVIIKNCKIKNFYEGMRIGWLENVTSRYSNGKGMSAQEMTKYAPSDIRVENVSITNSSARGLFIGDHAHDIEMVNLNISNTLGMALYLEFGSKNNKVINSVFTNNGHGNSELGIWQREAVSIDSSAYNEFTGNTFSKNGRGGIFLYKNCWEGHGLDGATDDMPRTQNTNFNRFVNNTFDEEKVGIWIASRQSYNLINFNCGNEEMITPKSTDKIKYYEDYARSNFVYKNIFTNSEKGVIVEDNDNFIISNEFKNFTSSNAIIVGTELRPNTIRADKSVRTEVRRTYIVNNKFDNDLPFSNFVSFVYGSQLPLAGSVHCANYFVKTFDSPLKIQGDILDNICEANIVKQLADAKFSILQ